MDIGVTVTAKENGVIGLPMEETLAPKWQCSFCTHSNESALAHCSSCGKSREESDEHFFTSFESAGPSEITATPTEPAQWSREWWHANTLALQKWLFASERTLWACGAALLAGTALVVWNIFSNTVVYKVAAVRWERTVPILRYQWVEREDWANELRGEGIQKISESMAIHHYEKRLVATRTLKAGERLPVYRDVPISALKIRYRTKMYAPIQNARASGQDSVPTWPAVKLGVGLDGKPDREEARKEFYAISLERMKDATSGPKAVTLTPTSSAFTRFHVGDTLRFKLDDAGLPRSSDTSAPITDMR
jgi:hypothetical protein